MEKQCIILASGNSIPFDDDKYKKTGIGIDDKLYNIIRKNYSFGLNYWFQYGCETTLNVNVDWQFYFDNKEKLEKLPLIICASDPSLKDKLFDNTIMLPHSPDNYFGEKSWDRGVYTRHLVGIWGLTLSIALGFDEIYLLGYDACEVNEKTHFYQDIVDLKERSSVANGNLKFRGVGKKNSKSYKTDPYNTPRVLNEKWFAPFKDISTKIYNVSPNSVINIFPKVTLDEFYTKIGNNNIDQESARNHIRSYINEKMS